MSERTRDPYEVPIEFALFVGILTTVLILGNALVFRFPLISSAGSITSDFLLYITFVGVLVVCFLLVVIMRRRMLAEMQANYEKLALSKMYEERFRMTIDNAPIGTAMIALDGSFIRVNQALSDMLGYSTGELLSRKLNEMQLPSETSTDDVFTERLIAGAIPKYKVSKSYVCKDGSIVEVIQSMSLVRGSGGSPLHLIAQLVDVTERNRARRALSAERERLSVTLRSIREGVVSTDTEGRVVLMNSAAEALTGMTESEAAGRPLHEVLDSLDPKTRELCAAAADEVLRSGGGVEFPGPMNAPADLGAARAIEGSAAPIRDRNGSVTGVVVVLTDITDRVRAEEQVRYLSFHDKLTGLYNRAYFEEELKRIDTGRQLPVSLIMGDVNGLKLVNDAFGHQRGDELLVQISRILRFCCRKEDVIARWGGDEFVIVLPRTSRGVAEQVCSRIRRVCSETEEDPVQPSIALGFDTKEEPGQDIREVLGAAEDRMYRKKLVEGKSARSSIITSLRRTLAERTCETEEHSLRLQNLALMVGRALGLSSPQLDELALLAVLHDIGKVAIPDAILMKPGRLSPEEWVIMRRHPEMGYRIALAAGDLAYVADDILSHHEWWNGTGYPRGLSGEEIPLLSRIVSVVDAYDAMTHDRPYEKAMSCGQALDELRQCAGTQFDPGIVETLIRLIVSRDHVAEASKALIFVDLPNDPL